MPKEVVVYNSSSASNVSEGDKRDGGLVQNPSNIRFREIQVGGGIEIPNFLRIDFLGFETGGCLRSGERILAAKAFGTNDPEVLNLLQRQRHYGSGADLSLVVAAEGGFSELSLNGVRFPALRETVVAGRGRLIRVTPMAIKGRELGLQLPQDAELNWGEFRQFGGRSEINVGGNLRFFGFGDRIFNPQTGEAVFIGEGGIFNAGAFFEGRAASSFARTAWDGIAPRGGEWKQLMGEEEPGFSFRTAPGVGVSVSAEKFRLGLNMKTGSHLIVLGRYWGDDFSGLLGFKAGGGINFGLLGNNFSITSPGPIELTGLQARTVAIGYDNSRTETVSP